MLCFCEPPPPRAVTWAPLWLRKWWVGLAARLLPAVHQKAPLRLLFAQLVAPCLRVTNVCVQLFEFVCSYLNDPTGKKRAETSERTNSENLKFKCLSNVTLLLCYSYRFFWGFFFVFISMKNRIYWRSQKNQREQNPLRPSS